MAAVTQAVDAGKKAILLEKNAFLGGGASMAEGLGAVQTRWQRDKNYSLAVETADSAAAQTYANYLVVKEGSEDTEKTKELEKALNSDEVRDYITTTFDGAVVPVF